MGGQHKLTGKVAEKALRMLSDVTFTLSKHKINYCLEGGTLLGIVRENRLLPWDDDLDITITEHQIPNLENALKSLPRKYRVRKRFYFTNHKAIKSGNLRLIRISNRKWYFLKGKVRMDIFVKYQDDNDYYWTVGSKKHYVIKSVPKDYYDNLTQYPFNGKSYSVPKNYKNYLTLRYSNWQQQVKKWNCLSGNNIILSHKNKHHGAAIK
ncbi:LicD family protein [Catenovulum sp. 2E275]|uniref:LicD family protein n=1 Tax=Catenovulum sp. 2E275 TaxID=2980497 RepID=UPI0021CEDCB2|nr:LicD family protein [Catenovulum sp. 2E275]MCU4674233.1 LicD family protein [Catenovulum sp. 2E275]